MYNVLLSKNKTRPLFFYHMSIEGVNEVLNRGDIYIYDQITISMEYKRNDNLLSIYLMSIYLKLGAVFVSINPEHKAEGVKLYNNLSFDVIKSKRWTVEVKE